MKTLLRHVPAKYLLIALSFISTSWSLPTIGVAETTADTYLPSFLGTDSNNIPDGATQQAMVQKLNILATQIKNQINTQESMIVTQEIDKKTITSVNLNAAHTEVSLESEPSILQKISQKANQLNPLSTNNNVAESQIIYPDYMLLSELYAVNAGNQINPISGTKQYSNIYSLDLAINYTLIKTSDQTVMATFISAGHAGVATLQYNDTPQTPNDTTSLIQTVYTQLGDDVVNRLDVQFNENISSLASSESTVKTTKPVQ
mgnify:CR=1 FL=1